MVERKKQQTGILRAGEGGQNKRLKEFLARFGRIANVALKKGKAKGSVGERDKKVVRYV